MKPELKPSIECNEFSFSFLFPALESLFLFFSCEGNWTDTEVQFSWSGILSLNSKASQIKFSEAAKFDAEEREK